MGKRDRFQTSRKGNQTDLQKNAQFERSYSVVLRNRGGGEAGSIARGISIVRTVSEARATGIEIGTKKTGGITKVTELTAGVS